MSGFNWDDAALTASKVIEALAPLAEAAAPAMAEGVAIGAKVVQGFLAMEPAAVALVNQIKNGIPATPAQIQDYAAAYEASYQKLHADIEARLAATP